MTGTQNLRSLEAVPSASGLAQFSCVRYNSSGQWALAGATDTDAVGCLRTDALDTTTPITAECLVNGQFVGLIMIAAGAITADTAVYAAASGQVASSGTVLRGLALTAATTQGDTVVVVPSAAAVLGAVARTGLSADTQPYSIDLMEMKVTGTGALLGATAGTPSGAFGLTVGTFGTNSPLLVGEAANNNSKTDACRFTFVVPAEYVSAGNITLQVSAKVTGALQVAQTIGASAYKSDLGGGIGSNLIATAAATLTTSFANYSFTITGTSLVPGDVVDIQLTGIANDTGGSANKLIQVGGVRLIMSVKG